VTGSRLFASQPWRVRRTSHWFLEGPLIFFALCYLLGMQSTRRAHAQDTATIARYCKGRAGFAGTMAKVREAGWSRARALDLVNHMHSFDNTPELRPHALDEVNKIYDDPPRTPALVTQTVFDACMKGGYRDDPR
jgi:hypothetical protein